MTYEEAVEAYALEARTSAQSVAEAIEFLGNQYVAYRILLLMIGREE